MYVYVWVYMHECIYMLYVVLIIVWPRIDVCMYVCIREKYCFLFMHTVEHVCVNACTHLYASHHTTTIAHVCMYVCMYVCTCVCMYVRVNVCMYVCMYVCTCASAYYLLCDCIRLICNAAHMYVLNIYVNMMHVCTNLCRNVYVSRCLLGLIR